MQLGNRIFPYPILNSIKELSEFNEDICFQLKIELDKNGEIIKHKNKALLKNVHFVLNDDYLLKLYKENKVSCYLIVESSSSIYRQRFELTNIPQTYEVELDKLKDDVYISAYLYAKCDIDNYASENFKADYYNYVFDIKKYDILAADDGFKFVVNRNLEEDNKVSSIFVIIRNEKAINTVSYEMDMDKIHIYLPPKYHDQYNELKSYSEYNDLFFSILAIPALTSCFFELQNLVKNGEDFNNISDTYRWFIPVLKRYKLEEKKELNVEEFKSLQPFELAQIVFNHSTANGINRLYEMANNTKSGGDDFD